MAMIGDPQPVMAALHVPGTVVLPSLLGPVWRKKKQDETGIHRGDMLMKI